MYIINNKCNDYWVNNNEIDCCSIINETNNNQESLQETEEIYTLVNQEINRSFNKCKINPYVKYEYEGIENLTQNLKIEKLNKNNICKEFLNNNERPTKLHKKSRGFNKNN